MKTILIDINKMILLKVVEGDKPVRCCEYWADILIPKAEFYICGDTGRELARFTLMELQMLYNNTAGAVAVFRDYPRAIEMVQVCIDKFEVAKLTLGDLVKKLGKPLKDQDFTPVKEKPEAKAKQVGNIPTRPKAGTMTARVWEAADWYYDQQDDKDLTSKELRDEVVQACVLGGVNSSTATTQFGKWKKALLAS
ncbi:MAG: hypothetical protein JKY62_16640 [Desulfocapsa sp.]|nr:hypothetical protein [Desulfocapsa sp.]